jgi:hypothetical protein
MVKVNARAMAMISALVILLRRFIGFCPISGYN